jgi:hypothetical protein
MHGSSFVAMHNQGEMNLKSCLVRIEPLLGQHASETPQDGTPPTAFTYFVLRHAFGVWIERSDLGEERG